MVNSIPSADRDLENRVTSFLWSRHVHSLRHVTVRADNGTVTLSGRVHSFYEKQLCHDCCRRVAGVMQLVDALDVAAPETADVGV